MHADHAPVRKSGGAVGEHTHRRKSEKEETEKLIVRGGSQISHEKHLRSCRTEMQRTVER